MVWETNELKATAYLTDSAAAVVTVSGTQKTKIASVTLHNTHTSDVIVKLYRVKNDAGSLGTASAANKVFEQSIKAGDTIIINPGWVLPLENDALFAEAAITSKVTICIDGQVAIV